MPLQGQTFPTLATDSEQDWPGSQSSPGTIHRTTITTQMRTCMQPSMRKSLMEHGG